jgi:hypothetical protein
LRWEINLFHGNKRTKGQDMKIINRRIIGVLGLVIAFGATYPAFADDEPTPPATGKTIATKAYVDDLATKRAKPSDIAMAVSALIPVSQKGAADGVATLDRDGKVPAAQIPALSYNDLTSAPTIPDDTDLVHKNGAETITGDKIFTGAIIVPPQTLP